MKKNIGSLSLLTLLSSSILFAGDSTPDLRDKLKKLQLQTPSKIEAQVNAQVNPSDWSEESYIRKKNLKTRLLISKRDTEIALTESELDRRDNDRTTRVLLDDFDKADKAREEEKAQLNEKLKFAEQDVAQKEAALQKRIDQAKKLTKEYEGEVEEQDQQIKKLREELKKSQNSYKTLYNEVKKFSSNSDGSSSTLSINSSTTGNSSKSSGLPPRANFSGSQKP